MMPSNFPANHVLRRFTDLTVRPYEQKQSNEFHFVSSFFLLVLMKDQRGGCPKKKIRKCNDIHYGGMF